MSSKKQNMEESVKNLIKARISPSMEIVNLIKVEVSSISDILDKRKSFDQLYEEASVVIEFTNKTFKEVQAIVEPLRIQNPDSHISLFADDNSFIGNVTWNDQMKMFWEYPVYSSIGNLLKSKRMEEAAINGEIASYE